MANLIGRTLLKRYRVDEFIGRGAMADVYKVWDEQRATYLAMKLLREDLAMDTIFIRRFRREAQALAQLQHPNIVRFYGLEEDGLLAFILMDFIDGTTLQHEIRVARCPLPFERILDIMRQVCSALHFAHQQGMIHCDIKPSNIMTHNNDTVLTDFGLAHMTETAATSSLLLGGGTFGYMSPEQARGEKPKVQTDIYALGIVLFEMLTGGERPFTGEISDSAGTTRDNVLWEQMNLTPPSIRRWNPDITDRLEQIVQKCLAREPVDRYSSALELLDALEGAVPTDRTVAAAPLVALKKTSSASASIAPPVRSTPARPRSWRIPLALVLVALIALAAGIVISNRLNSSTAGAVPAPGASVATATPTATFTATATATATSTATATNTPTPTPTATATPTFTATFTRRPTRVPPTLAPTSIPTTLPTPTLTLEPTKHPVPQPPPRSTPAPP
jgi:serine/threonine protein kinase